MANIQTQTTVQPQLKPTRDETNLYQFLDITPNADAETLAIIRNAKTNGVITLLEETRATAHKFIKPGWALLCLVVIVSFVHSWLALGALAPVTIGQLQIHRWVYWIVDACLVAVLDLSVLYLSLVHSLLERVQIAWRLNKYAMWYNLALVGTLNVYYATQHSKTLIAWLLRPVFNELFVIAIGVYIVVAYYIIKQAATLLHASVMILDAKLIVLHDIQKRNA